MEPPKAPGPHDLAIQELMSRRRHVRGRVEQDAQTNPGVALSHRRWSSRQLHRLGALSSHASAGMVVATVVAGWVAYGAVLDFPGWWLAVLEGTSAAVTVIMLFAIQHVQVREQMATQRKLDELLRAIPGADNRIIAVEEASDAELEALGELSRFDRDRPTDSR